jgi:hypothetical protein
VGSGTLDNLSRVKIALLRYRGSYASHSLMCPHTSLLRDRRLEHRAEKWTRFFRAQRCSHFMEKASDGSQKCKSTFGSDALVFACRQGRPLILLQ